MTSAVIGAGSLGCLVAGWLHEGAGSTVLCARSEVPEVRITDRAGTRTVAVPVVYDPGEVGVVDVVWLTTKAYDTAGAADWLRALVAEETVVVVVQNGVDHADRLAGLVPANQVLPAVAYIAAERVEPGHVRHDAGRRLLVPPGRTAARAVAATGDGRLDVRTSEDFRTEAWRKLLRNAAGNPICALTLARLRVFADPSVRAMARSVLEEVVAVGRAAGADLGPDDVEAVFAMFDGLPPDTGSSMLYDRLAGRRLEHEELTGVVVATADAHGVEVPVNRTLLALLRGLRSGEDSTEETGVNRSEPG
ncbi:2-dehydropantoate 2-reductase [Nocardioides mangrovicus]|nr:2-dehydropantoate 2-reductase [Nocardioides mangrovicus]